MIHLSLGVNDEVRARLDRLRVEFARASNWVAPIAQKNHCWNRVALHHLSYHGLREHFSDLGSQMACNAIYSVCRSYRLLLSHPQSPYFGRRLSEGQLPHLTFLDHSPVFFDRHTLSLQNNKLSLFTLEGRLRFQVSLSNADEKRFRTEKLREIQLLYGDEQYVMALLFDSSEKGVLDEKGMAPWPDYVLLKDGPLKNALKNIDVSNAPHLLKELS